MRLTKACFDLQLSRAIGPERLRGVCMLLRHIRASNGSSIVVLAVCRLARSQDHLGVSDPTQWSREGWDIPCPTPAADLGA